jgi:hypothetical protein
LIKIYNNKNIKNMKKNILLSTLLIATFILGASILVPESVFADKGIKTSGEGRRDSDNVDARLLNQEKESKLLPTSPFYFLKEWGRGMKMFFTFDPIKKSELEIKISDEKIVELAAVVEKEPQNEKAIQKALENYQKSKERLAKRLEELKETSQNPNVNKLLDKVVEQEIKHIEVFDGLPPLRTASKLARVIADAPNGRIVAEKGQSRKICPKSKICH